MLRKKCQDISGRLPIGSNLFLWVGIFSISLLHACSFNAASQKMVLDLSSFQQGYVQGTDTTSYKFGDGTTSAPSDLSGFNCFFVNVF